MAKRAPIEVIRAGTVHPGKYLILVGGAVADVEEALEAGREVGGSSVLDVVLIPNVRQDLVAAIRGERRAASGEALGSSRPAPSPPSSKPPMPAQGRPGPASSRSASPTTSAARATSCSTDGGDVEAAVEIGTGRIGGSPGLAWRVIPLLHAEMAPQPGRRRALRPRGSGSSRPCSWRA